MLKLQGKLMRIELLTVGLLATLMLVGCNPPPDDVKAPFPGRPDLLLADAYPEITVSPDIEKVLVFAPPIITPGTAEQPMRVTVPCRSIHDTYGINIQYKFEYFDADGRLLASNLGWRFQNLRPRVRVQLDSNALETKAKTWRLDVRSAR